MEVTRKGYKEKAHHPQSRGCVGFFYFGLASATQAGSPERGSGHVPGTTEASRRGRISDLATQVAQQQC